MHMMGLLHHSAATKSKTNRAGMVMGARLFIPTGRFFFHIYIFASFVFTLCDFFVLRLQLGAALKCLFCERNDIT
ncbi:hypothetical protein ACQKWADRAFT_160333 [Trichoderma austrokoningii]